MKIAQVSPLYESVPPKMYGGTERVISYLTEELVCQGHEVTLFASGDSMTNAHLIPSCPNSLRLNAHLSDDLVYHILMVEQVEKMKEEFDIIHYHIDYLHYPISRRSQARQVTTLHGRLDIEGLVPLYKEFSDMPLVSISYHQRLPIFDASWRGTVYHGLPENLLQFNKEGGGYLAFLGRISPEKRVDRAIEIATKCGIPIKIAAKIDKVDWEYYKIFIEPLFNNPLVEYIGEINEQEKSDFLGNAMAMLFPIDWPEPFGLVMIESMACGTPVVAFKKGSVPEIIDEGKTGYMVNSVEEAVNAVKFKVPHFDRSLARTVFEEKFSSKRMAKEYVEIYKKLILSSRNLDLQLKSRTI